MARTYCSKCKIKKGDIVNPLGNGVRRKDVEIKVTEITSTGLEGVVVRGDDEGEWRVGDAVSFTKYDVKKIGE
jgi:hypothetical protein